MKTRILFGILVVALAGAAQATLVTNWDSGTLNLAVPDNNPAGLAVSHTFTGLDNNLISDVEVQLNFSGGYNGDLYGYLIWQSADHSTTRTALLLNRIGTTATDSFGSDGAGFNITLSDHGTANGDIHLATGVPTGTWLADQSAGANSLNATFADATANGTWTLFLTDASGGDVSTLVSWGLNLTVVPEPVTWALLGFGTLMGGCVAVRRLRQSQVR